MNYIENANQKALDSLVSAQPYRIPVLFSKSNNVH